MCNAIRLTSQINSANSQIGPLHGYQNTLDPLEKCKIEATVFKAWADPEAGRENGPPPPQKKKKKKKKKKKIGFPCNIDLDPLKTTKLPSQHSMVAHYRHARETPFQWRFAGGPILARILWCLDPLSSHQLRKTLSNLDHLLQNFLHPRMFFVIMQA